MNKPKSVGIHIEDCIDVKLINNRTEGFDIGIQAIRTSGLSASDNVVISTEAVRILLDLEQQVRDCDAPHFVKGDLLEKVQEMRAAAKTPRFFAAYERFMSIAADHMAVLGPALTPLIVNMPLFMG